MNRPKITLKEMLRNLLATYEMQYIENLILKTILMGCPDAHTRDTWQQDVQTFLKDPQTIKAAHVAFVPLYAQIDAADDEAAVIELLSKLPITSKVN
jgi:hypothetical protein